MRSISFVVPALLLTAAPPAFADEEGLALAQRVAERPANEGRVATMHFLLTNRSGSQRERDAFLAHLHRGETERLAIYFEGPARLEGTAFLTHDHADRSDESWLYMPATDRVRQIPASDRGDYFLGTDLTYGDITDDFTFPLADWTFTHGGVVDLDGVPHEVLRGTPVSADVAEETGYGGFEALIDPETLFPVDITYLGEDGEPLKIARVMEQERVGEAWTAMRFTVENVRTGHSTEIWFEDMRAVPGLSEWAFEPDQLSFGPAEIN